MGTSFLFFSFDTLTCVDVQMLSPDSSPISLQGASRTTGGFARGHAAGNAYSFADSADEMDMDMPVARTGKVHLYTSQVNPLETKALRIMKLDVQFSLAPVLKSIAEKWSPIEIMAFGATDWTVLIIFLTESNPQVSVYEEGEWTDKGRYTAAVGFDEDVEWLKRKREYILPVCYVTLFSDSIWNFLFNNYWILGTTTSYNSIWFYWAYSSYYM